MSQCPKCRRQLTEDFGLIECPGCRTPLVLDLDGAVRVADDSADGSTAVNFGVLEEESNHPAPIMAAKDANKKFQDIGMDESENQTSDLSLMTSDIKGKPPQATTAQEVWGEPMQAVEGEENAVVEKVVEEGVAAEAPEEQGVEEIESNAISAESLDNEKPKEFGFLDEEEIEAPPIVQNPGDLSDLADFGNSVDSHSRDGGLRYKLIISGIDSADLRSALRDVLSDKRLLLDYEVLLKSVKDGVMLVDNINAVKATILIQRISELPIEIKWEQHAIFQK